MKRIFGHLLLGAAVLVLATCDDPVDPSAQPGPPAPTNVTVFPGPSFNENTISWPPTGAYPFVYWRTSPGVTPQNGTRVVNSGPPPLFTHGGPAANTHGGLTPNTTYYYVVTTYEDGIEGPASTEVQVTTSNDLGLRLDFPAAGKLAGEELSVGVRVMSRFQMGHVTATVADRSVDLVLTGPLWSGTLSLAGLPKGATLLTISATDTFGNVATGSVYFVHGELPTLTIAAPESLTVARPTLRVAASCVNEDLKGCASVTVKVANGPTLAAGEAAVDEIVSLPAYYDGRDVTLEFQGTDSAGRVTMTGSRRVLVESSPHLTEVDHFSGPILDVQPDRILFTDQANGGYALTIRDRMSGHDQVIYDQPGHVPSGRLTPVGAMFREATTDVPSHLPRVVHEWKSGALSEHGSSTFLVVKGPYGLFMTTAGLIRRDVVADVNTIVSAGGYGDVAENGDVAYDADYNSTGYQVYLFRNGTTTQLTHDLDQWGFGPVTDGVNVVYAKGFPPGYSVAFYDTSGEHVLGPSTGGYAAVNGWIGWGGAGGQVWARSPAGQVLQVSKFSSGSGFVALSPNGAVAFNNGARRYLAVPDYTVPPREIGSTLGTAFFQNGSLYVIIGRSLFQVNP